jgi:hypothetical protein
MSESIWKFTPPELDPKSAAALLQSAAQGLAREGLEKAAALVNLLDVAWCGVEIPEEILEEVVQVAEQHPGERPSFYFNTFRYSLSYVASAVLLLYDDTPGDLLRRLWKATPVDSLVYFGILEHPNTPFGVKQSIFLTHSGRFRQMREYMSMIECARDDREIMEVLMRSKNSVVQENLRRPPAKDQQEPREIRRHLSWYHYQAADPKSFGVPIQKNQLWGWQAG